MLVVCQSGLACQRDVKNVFAANMQFTSACFEHVMANVCQACDNYIISLNAQRGAFSCMLSKVKDDN